MAQKRAPRKPSPKRRASAKKTYKITEDAAALLEAADEARAVVVQVANDKRNVKFARVLRMSGVPSNVDPRRCVVLPTGVIKIVPHGSTFPGAVPTTSIEEEPSK